MYQSTHALTAYNALRLSGRSMTAEQIHAYAESVDYDSASLDDIRSGIAFLQQRGFVAVNTDGVVSPTRRRDGKPWPLNRTNKDRELIYR